MKNKVLVLWLALHALHGCGVGGEDRVVNKSILVHTTDAKVEVHSSPRSRLMAIDNDMVHWLEPNVGELPIRSEDEKARGQQLGREAPEPEFLQPLLDNGLPKFSPQLDTSISRQLIGGASDVLPSIAQLWIDAFQEIYPNVRIELSTPYAGSLAMLEVIEGNYDFVFVSRELKPTDVTSFNAKYGYDPLSIPISGGSYRHYGFLDAIGFFVNISNPLEKLSFDQIDAIFSSTRHRGGHPIRTWDELGLTDEWEDKPIHVYGLQPWNGFEEFVRQRVLNDGGKRGEWRDDINLSRDVFPIAEQVATDPYGIGYSGLAYLNHGVKVLPVASDETEQKYVSASYENVANAIYPLSRLIYFNANARPGKGLDPVLQELVRFILSKTGQQMVLDHGIYLPLRSNQVRNSISLLN